MTLSDFLAQHDFFTPMVFRTSAAAELGRPALAETALKQHRRAGVVASLHRHSLSAQAPLAKIVIRSKTAMVI